MLAITLLSRAFFSGLLLYFNLFVIIAATKTNEISFMIKKTITLTSLLFSQLAFANVSEGIVYQVECYQEKGIGVVEILTVEQEKLISNWVKVQSEHLCSGQPQNILAKNNSTITPFFGNVSPLSARGAQNTSSANLIIDSLTYNSEGFLTNIKKERIVSVEVMQSVSMHLHVDSEEAHDWYFDNRFH